MMLTKEECLQAHEILTDMLTVEEEQDGKAINKSIIAKDELDLFYKLIHEHFSNPPLKFEELIKHKVIWDNELKQYAFVIEQYKPIILNVTAPSDLQAISLEYRGGEIECLLSEKLEESINDYYTPNRFYRKEVKE